MENDREHDGLLLDRERMALVAGRVAALDAMVVGLLFSAHGRGDSIVRRAMWGAFSIGACESVPV